MMLCYACVCVCVCVCASTEAIGNPEAKRLYTDILIRSGYNKLIRPVGNNTDKLTVKLGLRLSQLIDVVRMSFYLLQ
jgi:hypothetical protein